MAKPASSAKKSVPAATPPAVKPAHKSLQELEREIHKLQEQAAALRRVEKAKAIAAAKELISKFGITAGELGLRAKPTLTLLPVKYADGKGNTWHGKGLRPAWLKQELAAGKSLEDFKVAPAKAPK